MKEKALTKISKPLEKALQGIAFWVSYSKMYFNNHKIQEGAIAHEFCKLLQSNLCNQDIVFQEEMLKKFIDTGNNTQQRVDVLIRNSEAQETFAIEVKRYTSNKLINEDLKKLLEIKVSRPEITCYLLVVSENKHMSRFINKKGNALRVYFKLDGCEVNYKVRRVCKSASSFKKEKIISANYALLIEVLLPK